MRFFLLIWSPRNLQVVPKGSSSRESTSSGERVPPTPWFDASNNRFTVLQWWVDGAETCMEPSDATAEGRRWPHQALRRVDDTWDDRSICFPHWRSSKQKWFMWPCKIPVSVFQFFKKTKDPCLYFYPYSYYHASLNFISANKITHKSFTSINSIPFNMKNIFCNSWPSLAQFV